VQSAILIWEDDKKNFKIIDEIAVALAPLKTLQS
jgi:hypothetical protein